MQLQLTVVCQISAELPPMCGIVSSIRYAGSGHEVDAKVLLQMRDAMRVRGPDGEGLWISSDRRVGLGHRRLAILDLSDAGAQPMSIDGGRFQIVFNGEIYNYPELKRVLEREGTRLISGSDTEVLLHLYRIFGSRMVDHIRGMYAFVIWDDLEKQLYVARDPFGVKPLYFTERAGTIHIASQVQALMPVVKLSNGISAAGLVGYYLWGHVPEPFTLFQDIRAFPAGSYGVVKFGQSIKI